MSYKEALEDMVWQFAYRRTKDGKIMLCAGGLSALESAFDALGWDNPHFINDDSMECDIKRCHDWRSSQIHWDGIYVMICEKHFNDYCNKKPLPKLKQSAINRESRRDISGCLFTSSSFYGRVRR